MREKVGMCLLPRLWGRGKWITHLPNLTPRHRAHRVWRKNGNSKPGETLSKYSCCRKQRSVDSVWQRVRNKRNKAESSQQGQKRADRRRNISTNRKAHKSSVNRRGSPVDLVSWHQDREGWLHSLRWKTSRDLLLLIIKVRFWHGLCW